MGEAGWRCVGEVGSWVGGVRGAWEGVGGVCAGVGRGVGGACMGRVLGGGVCRGGGGPVWEVGVGGVRGVCVGRVWGQ